MGMPRHLLPSRESSWWRRTCVPLRTYDGGPCYGLRDRRDLPFSLLVKTFIADEFFVLRTSRELGCVRRQANAIRVPWVGELWLARRRQGRQWLRQFW
jgi:hypothetical protein